MSNQQWKVQVKGTRCSGDWEISVVHRENKHGQRSFGWIGDHKLLVGHNGGPCRDSVCGFVWDRLIEVAEELCGRLNSGEDIDRKGSGLPGG